MEKSPDKKKPKDEQAQELTDFGTNTVKINCLPHNPYF